jgi:hypothetical protein
MGEQKFISSTLLGVERSVLTAAGFTFVERFASMFSAGG